MASNKPLHPWNRLPCELHIAIAERCDVFTITKLRLTNRYMRKVSQPAFLRLFEHVAIYLTPWSLPILIDIVQQPEIARTVKSITVELVEGWQRTELGRHIYERSVHGQQDRSAARGELNSSLQDFEERYQRSVFLSSQLTTAIKPLFNVTRLGFDCSEGIWHCRRRSQDYSWTQRDREYIDNAKELVKKGEPHGLGIRSFLREFVLTKADKLPITLEPDSGVSSSLEVQVAEKYLSTGCYDDRMASIVFSVFVRLDIKLHSYRDYGYHVEQYQERLCNQYPWALMIVEYQPMMANLTSFHFHISGYERTSSFNPIRYLHAMEKLRVLRIECSTIAKDWKPGLRLREFFDALWHLQHLRELVTLVVSCLWVFDAEARIPMLEFLRNRRKSLRQVAFAAEQHSADLRDFYRCVRDDLDLDFLGIHQLGLHKLGRRNVSCRGLDDGVILGQQDQSHPLLIPYYNRYDTDSVEFNGHVKSKVKLFLTHMTIKRRGSFPQSGKRPRIEFND